MKKIILLLIFCFLSWQVSAIETITYIISLKSKVAANSLFKDTLKWKRIGNSNLFQVIIDKEKKSLFLDKLKGNSSVEFIERAGHGHFDNINIDTDFSNTEWFKEIQGSKIQGLSLNKKVLVALIDSGIDLNNNFYKQYVFINKDEIAGDGIDNDGNGFIDDVIGWDFGANDNMPQDELGHGTMTGSLILALCPNAVILPLKVNKGMDDSFSLDNLVSAIYYAMDMGAKIINLSLSMSESSMALELVLREAYNRGIIIVSSAGNDPSKISFPASMQETIAVGSVYKDLPAWFSPAGEELDLVAPGVDIECLGLGGIRVNASGTSLSAAIVSGASAVLLSMNPYLTPLHVKEFLEQGCKDLGEEGKDFIFGAGEILGTNLSQVVLPKIILPKNLFYAFNAQHPIDVGFYLPPTDVYTNVYIALEFPTHEFWSLNINGLWEQGIFPISSFLLSDFLQGTLFGSEGVFSSFKANGIPTGLYKWWIGLTDNNGVLLSHPTYTYMLLF